MKRITRQIAFITLTSLFTNFVMASEMSGVWYNPDEPNHGINLVVSKDQQGESVATVYWYLYGSTGAPMFLLGSNQVAFQQEDAFLATMNLYMYRDGQLGYSGRPVEMPCGHLTLSREPEGELMQVDFDIAYVSNDNCYLLIGVPDYSAQFRQLVSIDETGDPIEGFKLTSFDFEITPLRSSPNFYRLDGTKVSAASATTQVTKDTVVTFRVDMDEYPSTWSPVVDSFAVIKEGVVDPRSLFPQWNESIYCWLSAYGDFRTCDLIGEYQRSGWACLIVPAGNNVYFSPQVDDTVSEPTPQTWTGTVTIQLEEFDTFELAQEACYQSGNEAPEPEEFEKKRVYREFELEINPEDRRFYYNWAGGQPSIVRERATTTMAEYAIISFDLTTEDEQPESWTTDAVAYVTPLRNAAIIGPGGNEETAAQLECLPNPVGAAHFNCDNLTKFESGDNVGTCMRFEPGDTLVLKSRVFYAANSGDVWKADVRMYYENFETAEEARAACPEDPRWEDF